MLGVQLLQDWFNVLVGHSSLYLVQEVVLFCMHLGEGEEAAPSQVFIFVIV